MNTMEDDHFGAVEGGVVTLPRTARDPGAPPLGRVVVAASRVRLAERIRRRPAATFAVAFGTGWLVAKLLRASLRASRR